MAVGSPSVEPMLAERHDVTAPATGKAQLPRRACLPGRPELPLFAQIGRLDPQKGWDLLAGVADDLLSGDVPMVLPGEGHPCYHELLDRLADKHSGKLRAFLKFSSTRTHQIEAGADIFLMPSLCDPWGPNQLVSLAHGIVRVVRATDRRTTRGWDDGRRRTENGGGGVPPSDLRPCAIRSLNFACRDARCKRFPWP